MHTTPTWRQIVNLTLWYKILFEHFTVIQLAQQYNHHLILPEPTTHAELHNQSTQWHSPHQHHSENLKFHIFQDLFNINHPHIYLDNQVVSAFEIQNPSSCLCLLFLPTHVYFTLHTPHIRRYVSPNIKITCLNSFRVRFILSLLEVQLVQLYHSKVKQYHLLKLN